MARTAASVGTDLDLKILKAQADEIAKKFKTPEAKAAWEGPWKEHHEAFRSFAEAQGVKLVEREFDTPAGPTPYSYNNCYHWFVTGRKDGNKIEICDLRRSRKRLDGTLKCVYDCGFFTPA
jgi:hypothetical protein